MRNRSLVLLIALLGPLACADDSVVSGPANADAAATDASADVVALPDVAAQQDATVALDGGPKDAGHGDASASDASDSAGDAAIDGGDATGTGDSSDIWQLPVDCTSDLACAASDTAPCHVAKCIAGACVTSPQADGAECEDGDLCTGGDTCASGQCAAGAAVACDDGQPCSDDSCDPATGCKHAQNSASCDDGDACTTADTCAGGTCSGGPALACNDGNPCTDDSCSESKGCIAGANTATCDDGNACTTKDTCSGGKCGKGVAKSCDDNNPCSDDSCDEVKGCVSAANSAVCSDGNACTAGDACKSGACTSGPALACVDVNPCTMDFCDPAKGCQHPHSTLPCDDGDACTAADTCAAGKCAPGAALVCADGNPCTDDACDPVKGCTHADSSKLCDDGNKCTLEDRCQGGSCVPGKAPECDDGNPCTAATCDPGKGCANLPNTLPCSDGDACSGADVCAGGKCKGGAAVVCLDGNGCTADSCDAAKGCVFLPAPVTCTDGNSCTVSDACKGGACVAGAAAQCDDNNPCTTDLCKPQSGCASEANTLPCDDGSVCTAGDVCTAKVCVPGKALPCADGNSCTDDGCDKADGCVFLANQATCSDGNACSADDTCSKGGCVAGKAMDCDDANVCTLNYCDALAGCKAVAKPGPCDDASACTSDDGCVADKCVGKAVDCDDSNPCSKDSCDPSNGCLNAPLDGTACGQGGVCKVGTCIAGTQTNPAASCSELRQLAPGTASGLHWIDPDGKQGQAAPYRVHCDMGHDGGGWTLVAVASSDGQNTWTWNNRTYWTTNTKTFGDMQALNKDFKSPAYHGLMVQEVLFLHQPSNVWATYLVGDGKASLAALQTSFGGPKCQDPIKDGFKRVAGNLKVGGKLCNDKLYWAPMDKDGSANCGDNEHSFGPTFNGRDNAATCHFDDPGLSGGLGPVSNSTGHEFPALGFGRALGLNKGAAGSAKNFIQVYVRMLPPPGCGNGKLEPGEACDDGNELTGDGCSKSCVVEVFASCKAVAKGAASGIYLIDPDGEGPISPFATRCEMALDGGGWTLVAVSSDDGKHTWTWNNRTYWTSNQTVFGDVAELHRDFKSRALQDVAFSDVLFVHAPSNTWAAYGKVGDGKSSLAQHIAMVGGPKCHLAGSGHALTAGTLKASGNLCETRLYFNAHDHDGNATACGDDDATWGPSWNGKSNNGCPFDDPASTGSLGPMIGSGGSERPASGWGWALGLNKGAAGSGANHMKVYIR